MKNFYINEILTLDYPVKHVGNYIDRWFIVMSDTRQIKRFKTEAGALRLYEKITSHATLFRETDCKGADVVILTK